MAIRLNGAQELDRPMWKYALIVVLVAAPVAAQVKPAPKAAVTRSDPCEPIGRTADGKLVYSMKCQNLPVPPPASPPPQAELNEAAPPAEPEPETRRSGIFGWSYDRR